MTVWSGSVGFQEICYGHIEARLGWDNSAKSYIGSLVKVGSKTLCAILSQSSGSNSDNRIILL